MSPRRNQSTTFAFEPCRDRDVSSDTGKMGRKRCARTKLLPACSHVRMNLKRGPGEGYHEDRNLWTVSDRFSGHVLGPGVVVDKGIPTPVQAGSNGAASIGTVGTTKHRLALGEIGEGAVKGELEAWIT